MKKVFLITTLIILGCAGRQGTVLKTWTSLDDYAISISTDQGNVEMTVTPSVRVETIDDVFYKHLNLNIRYPDADERIDVGIISIFSSDEPRVELLPIRVEVDYILLDEATASDEFDDPSPRDWKTEGSYRMNPGDDRKLKIRNAAGRRMVVVRSQLYNARDGELLTRYLHGFEIE